MYRQLYVEWIFVHQNEHGFIKKKKEIHVQLYYVQKKQRCRVQKYNM